MSMPGLAWSRIGAARKAWSGSGEERT